MPDARHAGELRREMKQRVLQSAGAVAGARMHDESGRLVDDEECIVLVHHRHGDRLRCGGESVGLDDGPHDHALVAADPLCRGRHPSFERHASRVDPRAEPAA